MSGPSLVFDVEGPVSPSKWAPRPSTILLAISFLGSAAFGGTAYYFYALAEASHAINANSGRAEIADTVLDLGTLWPEHRHRVAIPVTNAGTAELTLDRFSTSCSCTGVDPKSLAVPPGGTGTFYALLDLTSDQPQDCQVRMRRTEVRILAESAGERPLKLTWTLRAAVRNAIGLNPNVVFNGPLIIGADPPRQSLPIVAHVPLQNIVATCDPTKAELNIARTRGERGSWELNIQPKLRESTGTFKFPITLTPVPTENGDTIPSVKIQVQGRVVEDIYATPSSIAGGMLREGRRLEAEVVLASLQQHPFEIKKIEPSDSAIKVALVGNDRSWDSPCIRVTSDALPVGEIKASIAIFAFDKASERQMRINVPVTAYVLPPR